jgi:hypothetical protein
VRSEEDGGRFKLMSSAKAFHAEAEADFGSGALRGDPSSYRPTSRLNLPSIHYRTKGRNTL